MAYSAPKAKKSAIRIRLDCYGSETDEKEFWEKWQLIKQQHKPGIKVTNLETFQEICNYWLINHQAPVTTAQNVVTPLDKQNYEQRTASFNLLNVEQSEVESVHMVGISALVELERVFNNHSKKCSGYLKLDASDISTSGYWNRFLLACSHKPCKVYGYEKFKWATSAYISQRDSFINERVKHAANVAGLLPSQLDVFTEVANICSSSSRILSPTTSKIYSDSVVQVGFQSVCSSEIIFWCCLQINTYYC